ESVVCKGEDWLLQYPDHYNFINNPHNTLDHLLTLCQEKNVSGVLSSDDYPGSIFASIVAQQLGLPGPCPQAILLCHHKYYARRAQQQHVPQAMPQFMLHDPQQEIKNISLPFPL